MSPYIRLLFAVAICACQGILSRTEAQSAQAPEHAFVSGTTAVTIDAIVRDSKGAPVTGLGTSDFQVFEDGVQQDVADVTAVAPMTPRGLDSFGGSTSGSRDAAGGRSTPAITTPRYVALVFDRLSPEARDLAYKGALASVDILQHDDFVAVYLADLSLRTIQPYTNNREDIRTALKRVASRATSSFDQVATNDPLRSRDGFGNPEPGDARPSVPVVASPESVGRPVDNRNIAAREVAALDLGTQMTWEIMARQQQGLATTNALLAVTSALGTLQGRKSVIFFAEGLALPDAVLPRFRDVVATANHGNVSVYTIDASGLRVHSQMAETARELNAMAEAADISALEHVGDVLKKDARTSLSLVAQQTGGFLVENTNDLAKAFRQVDRDSQFYYLLTYVPKNTTLDGTWRTVSVRVPSRRVVVRARSGYLAVRTPTNYPLLNDEAEALAALDGHPTENDVALKTAALVFPRAGESRVVVVAVPDSGAIRFAHDENRRTSEAKVNLVARVVNSSGAVVRQAGQAYRLSGSGSVQQLDGSGPPDIIFTRQFNLPPGGYTLEIGVHDGLASRSGAKRVPFAVPLTSALTLRVSSLVLVSHSEPTGDVDVNDDNPLRLGIVRLIPSLGKGISRSQEGKLSFYVVVTPGSGSSVTADLQLLQGTRVLAQGPLQMSKPDASGDIAQVAQLPLDGVMPGSYVLRLTVYQADRREVRESAFEVVE